MSHFGKRLGAWMLAELLAPGVALWSRRQERRILREGRALNVLESEFAQSLGGSLRVENIRILAMETIPMPIPAFLLRLAQRWCIGCPHPAGMTLGNGIYVVSEWADNLPLIRHELVHVLQYQRLGGHWHFMRKYLRECLAHSYELAPMEMEARERSHF